MADPVPLESPRRLWCRHCGVHIYADTRATGPGGCWRSPDGLTCTHPAGHMPRHDDPRPYRERMGPGY